MLLLKKYFPFHPTSSHNGMALKEEFEYLSFRCCYCYYLNPAKKQRPFAPRMEFFNPLHKGQGNKVAKPAPEESSEEDDSSEEDEISKSGSDGKKVEGAATASAQPSSSSTIVESLLKKPSVEEVKSIKKQISFEDSELSEIQKPVVEEELIPLADAEELIPLADAEEVIDEAVTEAQSDEMMLQLPADAAASSAENAVSGEVVSAAVSDGSDESFEQLSVPSDDGIPATGITNDDIDPNQNTAEAEGPSEDLVSAAPEDGTDVADATSG